MAEPASAEKSANVELNGGTSTSKDEGKKPISTFARVSILLTVLCASFLFALDSTIVAVVQSTLIHRFNEIEKLPWITVAYQLGGASVNLLWGRAYVNFDHKYLFITAVVFFEVGSAVCGGAPSMNAFIVGRVICGIGGNGIYNGSINILSNLSSIEKRALYLSFFGVLWGVGTVLGPIVGGALTSSSYNGWRWCFYLNLCVAALCAPIYLFVLPSFPQARGRTILERLRKVDYFGNAVFIGGWVAGVIALSFGGAMYPWSSANIIVPLCFSGVLFIAFAIQQKYCIFVKPENRAFPVHLLNVWENWVFFAITAAAHASQFIPIYYIPLYFQFINNNSALDAGLRLLPFICATVFFCLLNGALMVKLGYYAPWFIAGSAAVVTGAALMSTVSAGTAHSAIYGFSFLLSAGNGAFTQASFPVVQTKSPRAEVPNVIAMLVCAQRIGVTVGTSVANSIFINRAPSLIARVLPNAPRSSIEANIAGGSGVVFDSLPPAQKEGVLEAIATAIDDCYYQVLAGGAVCLVLSLFIKRERLFKPAPKPAPKQVTPDSSLDNSRPSDS